jgi:hypothetical protein
MNELLSFTRYMGSMVGSTVLNATLIRWGWNRIAASITTLFVFACMNFFVLKFLNSKVVYDFNEEVENIHYVKWNKKLKLTNPIYKLET